MKLTLSMAQMRVIRSKPEENLRKAEGWIAEAVRRECRLICFPEMWTTGFDWDYNARYAGEQAAVIERISAMARKHGIWINGSLPALDDLGRLANTSILFDDRGRQAGLYRKTHLFSFMHEERHMAPGDRLTVVQTPWGLTGLSICYDIRFPELFRTYALKGVRLVLSPMAFPHPRLEHWKILVRARAIENQMFMAGINQVGSEDFGAEGPVTYFGDSVVIDPWGNTVIEANETDEQLLTATVDLDQVDEIRSRMKVLQDRRPDLYEVS